MAYAPSFHFHNHHREAWRLVIAVLGALAILIGLGLAGFSALERVVEQRRVVALMGPKGNLQELPEMHFPLTGVRTLDLKVTLELPAKVRGKVVEERLDRIEDRLYDGVRDIGEDGLVGPGSANRVKQVVRDAVRRETGREVKQVLVERMVLR